MKASIIIPTYNRGYIIRGALESALAQTYRDFEIVVLDDGSTDNTHEIVKSMRSDKIRYVRHERNCGYGAACNSGISAATGDFIGFLDSDDLWLPDKLEQQVGFLLRHPQVDAVFTDVEVVGNLQKIPSLIGIMRHFSKLLEPKRDAVEYVINGRDMYLCLLEELPIKPTAFLCKRETYARIGTFDEVWPSGTDWELFLRFARSCRFGYIDRPLAILRTEPDATHLKFREQDKLFLLSLFLKERRKLARDREALAAVNRGIAEHYRNLGLDYLNSGQPGKSLLFYVRGFKDTGETVMLLRAACVFLPGRLREALRNAFRSARVFRLSKIMRSHA